MTPLFRKLLGLNWVLVASMYGLIAFGAFAIYSAGSYQDEEHIATAWNQHILYAGLGSVLFFGAALTPYRLILWVAPVVYLVGIGLLLMLGIYGDEAGGQKNWLSIGGFRFQPSQVALVGGIFILAVTLGELQRTWPIFRHHFLRLGVSGVLAGIPMALVAMEDPGSGLVWIPVVAACWLVASIPFRYLIVITQLGLCAVPILYFFVLEPHQKNRVDVQMALWQGKPIDIQGEGYALHYVTLAIATGGFEGKGYLGSRVSGGKTINRMGFIPKRTAMNDYIFAVVAEDFGFQGALLLVTAYGLLLLQMVFVAFYARDQLGRILVTGTLAALFMHVVWNIGMCVWLFPVAGIPLPFVSYGGTFLLIVMFLMGITQSVWVHRAQPKEEQKRQPKYV